jgi:hypothetical protein
VPGEAAGDEIGFVAKLASVLANSPPSFLGNISVVPQCLGNGHQRNVQIFSDILHSDCQSEPPS